MYEKRSGFLLAALLSAVAATGQDQTFSNIILNDPAYPKINFNGRLLYRGVGGNELSWRYDGTNDGIVLHTANFNAYAPTLTGIGASGNWPISVSGFSRGLISYSGANQLHWGWSGSKLQLKIDNTDLSTGLPADITGNAATWSGQSFEGVATTPISYYMLGLKANGVWGAYDATQIRSFLNIPASGETLQSVMDRGKQSSPGTELQMVSGDPGLFTYVGGGPAYGRIGTYSGSGNNKFIINEGGGFVGIGNINPVCNLDVNGSFRIGDNNNFITYNGAADFSMRFIDRGSGGRAMVHADGNMLALNFGGDFTGGTLLGNRAFFANGDGNSFINTGTLGIGIATPNAKLDVAGVIQTRNLTIPDAYWDNLRIFSDGSSSYIQSSGDEDGLKIKSKGGNKVLFDSKVGIGTESVSDENFNLFVEKGIRTRKLKVDQAVWADYVFDSSYQLQPLHQVEKYIQENKHLPEVPSAAEVKKEGVDVSDNQALLLKKIEELTLYIIQQNKDMETMKKRMEELEKKVK